MIDSFVLLAPILMLPVVSLLGFVGCDLVFGLTPVASGPEPTNLVATPGNMKVALSWDPYPDAATFTVKRGTTSGVYDTSFSVPGSQTSFTDGNVTNGTTYFYVVTAVVAGQESNRSEEAMATPAAASLLSFVTAYMPIQVTTGAPSGWYGMVVLVGGAALDVQTLGRGFVAGNSQIHVIKIVAATGVDVPNAFVSVNMAGGVAAEFRYAPLVPPVTLQPNGRYYIVSQEIAGQDEFYNHDMAIQTTDAGTVPFAVLGGPPYTENSSANRSFGPVNFQY